MQQVGQRGFGLYGRGGQGRTNTSTYLTAYVPPHRLKRLDLPERRGRNRDGDGLFIVVYGADLGIFSRQPGCVVALAGRLEPQKQHAVAILKPLLNGVVDGIADVDVSVGPDNAIVNVMLVCHGAVK